MGLDNNGAKKKYNVKQGFELVKDDVPVLDVSKLNCNVDLSGVTKYLVVLGCDVDLSLNNDEHPFLLLLQCDNDL